MDRKEETNREFIAFLKWKESLEFDLGEDREDWEPWWECFRAGYRAAYENEKGD